MIRIREARKAFFDSELVTGKVDRAAVRVLSRFGAFVRRSAQFLIRRRKRGSRKGEPPTNRTGILKRFLYFVWDQSERSVVVGPAKTNQVFFDGDGKPVTGTVPEILEYGGEINVREAQNPITGQWRRADLRFRHEGGQAGWPQRMRTVAIDERPYMGPAYKKEQPKLPAMWRDAVKP